MNRKAVDYYAIFIFIAVIIAITALVVKISDTVDVQHKPLGDKQKALLNTAPQTQAIRAYLISAAQQTMEQTLKDVAQNPVYQGFSAEDGNCPELNPEAPKDYRKPNFNDGITAAFNKNFNAHLDTYAEKTGIMLPKNNYELYITKESINAIAKQPITLPLTDRYNKEIGQMTWYPSFTLNYENKFEDLDNNLFIIGAISGGCLYNENPTACMGVVGAMTIGSGVTGWDFEDKQTSVIFKAPIGNYQTCYTVNIPKKEPATP